MRVKVLHESVNLWDAEEVCRKAGMTITSETCEPGYPICGDIDEAGLAELRRSYRITSVEVLPETPES